MTDPTQVKGDTDFPGLRGNLEGYLSLWEDKEEKVRQLRMREVEGENL